MILLQLLEMRHSLISLREVLRVAFSNTKRAAAPPRNNMSLLAACIAVDDWQTVESNIVAPAADGIGDW